MIFLISQVLFIYIAKCFITFVNYQICEKLPGQVSEPRISLADAANGLLSENTVLKIDDFYNK